MKRIVSIIVWLFCGLGILLWLTQSFVNTWEPRIRIQLENRLGTALKARVQIEGIVPSLLIHRIHLIDVRVYDQNAPGALIFRSADVSLTISLIDLPRALADRNPIEAIGLVSVESPWLILSPKIIQERAHGGSGKTELPILFTLVWDYGTIQWKDPQGPHGIWTLYQAQGVFRIRGPHMDFATRGSMEAAENVRFQFSSFGHRWNAQNIITSGDIHQALSVAQRFTHKPLTPAFANPRGHFNLQLNLGGRQWPHAGDKFLNFIQRGRLSFADAEFDIHPKAPPVQVNGTVLMDGSRVTTSNLTLSAAHRTLAISGSLSPVGLDARVNIQATSKDFDLALLSAYAGMPEGWEGGGTVEILAEGPLSEPDLTLKARIPQGHVSGLPFEDGQFNIHRSHNRWEFVDNSVRFLDGHVTLKGYASAQTSDLQLTGENLVLDQRAHEAKAPWVQGRLNFSSSIQGAAADLHASGSLWVNNFIWGTAAPDSLRGDFEVAPDHFQAEASSDHSGFHFSAEGTSDDNEITLDQLGLRLPSGASLTGEAALTKSSQKIKGTFDAKQIAVPDDLPMLQRWTTGIAGTLNGHGRLLGTWHGPIIQGNVLSDDLTVGSETISKATANFLWDGAQFSVPSFALEPGIEGAWSRQATDVGPAPLMLKLDLSNASASLLSRLILQKAPVTGHLSGHVSIKRSAAFEGSGRLSLTNGSVGNWPVSNLAAQFAIGATTFDLKSVTLDSPRVKASLHGQAFWTLPRAGAAPETIRFKGDGTISSGETGTSWNLPLQWDGRMAWGAPWAGEAQFRSAKASIGRNLTEPLEAAVEWDQNHLRWHEMRWGSEWTSNGTLHFGNDSPQVSAQTELHGVSLAPYQQLLWPENKEPTEGRASGLITLTGSLDHPSAVLALQLDDGVWRAFHYSSSLHGTWTAAGWQPLSVQGRLASGGEFDFEGKLRPTPSHVEGSLKLTGINLRPLGDSLSFPKSLDGIAAGTLTANGPLDALSFKGHLEASPLVYGQSSPNPFRLENASLDLTLAPDPDKPGVTRLSITQGLAKTAEEQIRLDGGSFIDFSGKNEAQLRVGTEIRNLHLGLFTLFGGLDLAGTWQIKPAGFALQGDLHTRSLYINDYELEEGHVNADYYDSVLHFRPPEQGPSLVTGTLDFHKAPQLKFTDFYISGREHEGLKLTGDVGPSLWDFKLQGQGLDISTLSGLAGFPYPLRGTANVVIHGTGDLLHPHVDGTLDLQQGSALGLSFHTGSAAFVWQDYRMTFTRLLLSDPGRYTLTGSGIFPLATKGKNKNSDPTINFSMRLQDSNLGLLQSISSEVKQARGAVDGLLQIQGTPDQPILHGSVHVLNGDIVGAHYFRHLENLRVSADFEGDELLIRDFHGKSGNGEFQIGGTIAFAGFLPRAYDLRADVISKKGVDVTVPELAIPESPLAKRFHFLTTASRADVRGHVTFQGPADAPTFQGEGTISNGHFSFPPSRKSPPPPGVLEWFRRINWDVDLHFADGAWFENELVEANLVGTLHLKGPSDRLRVDGGTDISEGKISYLSLEFDIQQARFDLRSQEGDQGVVNTPYVRGIAQATVQAVDTVEGQAPTDTSSRIDINDTITLTIDYAPVDEIKPRLTSLTNPSLSQDKLIARVTQLDTDSLTPQEKNTLYQQQMVRVLDTSVATPLAKNLLRRTGLVDNFRVSQVADPSATLPPDAVAGAAATQSQTSLLANTKYTFEKNLNSRLSLGYGVRFLETTSPDNLSSRLDLVNDVEMSYRWFHNIYLKGTFDLPSSNPSIVPERKVTIEPRWRFGWWGNTNKDKVNPPPTSPTSLSPGN